MTADTDTKPASIQRRLNEMAHSARRAAGTDFEEALALLDEALGDDGGLLRLAVGQRRLQQGLAETLRAAAPAGGAGGQQATGTQIKDASRPAAGAAPTAAQTAATGAVARRLANSLLSAVVIDGVPIRVCTKGRVLASAHHDDILSRFKRALVHGLPSDDAVVGDYLDDDHADKAMAAARAGAREAG